MPYDIGYAVPGDRLGAEVLRDAEELTIGHFLTGIDVLAPYDTRIAVAFKDSWIEGAFTTPGTDRSFPAQLSRRLSRGWTVNQASPETACSPTRSASTCSPGWNATSSRCPASATS
ncbi:hypothetical protein AB0D27_36530 [Streptomyces sp. NPDC048415]|uniref:hypothetical protein n=1 Tax=Streptomyces sp. NPDC048415 TaxID=3154822 RepID=UPI003420D602